MIAPPPPSVLCPQDVCWYRDVDPEELLHAKPEPDPIPQVVLDNVNYFFHPAHQQIGPGLGPNYCRQCLENDKVFIKHPGRCKFHPRRTTREDGATQVRLTKLIRARLEEYKKDAGAGGGGSSPSGSSSSGGGSSSGGSSSGGSSSGGSASNGGSASSGGSSASASSSPSSSSAAAGTGAGAGGQSRGRGGQGGSGRGGKGLQLGVRGGGVGGKGRGRGRGRSRGRGR